MTTFVEKQTVVHADWLNGVDGLVNTVFEGAQTNPLARTALNSDNPMEITNGGTGARDPVTALANLGGLPTTSFTQLNIGQTLFPRSQAETTAGITPSNPYYYYGDVRRYGAALDGATDCVAAMANALAVGGEIYIPGPMVLASASLAALPNQSLTVNSNTKIRGTPGYPCTVTGTTACNVFYSTDVSNVEFIDFFCVGNGASSATTTTGYFWYIKCSATPAANSTDLKFIRGGLSNFSGLYWIYVDNTAATTFIVRNFICDGARFFSQSGNSQSPTVITYTATVLGFSGSNTVTTLYTVQDVVIRNCYADGTHIKNFVTFWSGVIRCKVYSCTLVGFGTGSEFADDSGCYALTAYDFSHGAALPPDAVEFYNNTIEGVRDCGIYAAAANRIRYSGNTVANQTSAANTTLPKGGIVLNGCNFATADNNRMYNCRIGVAVAQAPGGNNVARVNDTMCNGAPNSGVGMILSGTSGGPAQDIAVDGYKFQTAGTGTTGILCNFTATVGVANLEIRDFQIDAAGNGIQVYAADTTVPALGNVYIGNGKIRGSQVNGLVFTSCTNTSQHIQVENVTFADMQAAAAGLFATGVVGMTVRNILFIGLASGATFCWYGGGATGRMENVRFQGVAIANRYDSSANRMGVDAPTWTGNINDFVIDLNITELGTTPNKYVRMGWTWDRVAASWKECRALTGN